MARATVTDEQAAMFANKLENKQIIELQGVSIYHGKHPIEGEAMVICPVMGDHMIMIYPFAGDEIFYYKEV